MSNRLLSQAWAARGLRPGPKLVLLYMADVAREPDCECFALLETIAETCGLTERTVRSSIAQLKAGKHIHERRRKNRTARDVPRFCFVVHPLTPEAISGVTPENNDADTGKQRPPHRKITTPTPENFSVPILTSTNPFNPINDATAPGDGSGKDSPFIVHRLNASRENELMSRLRALLGKDELDRAGGNWRENWVRKQPGLLTRALNDLECEIKEGRDKSNRGAWLTDLLKRWSNPCQTEPARIHPSPELARKFRADAEAKMNQETP